MFIRFKPKSWCPKKYKLMIRDRSILFCCYNSESKKIGLSLNCKKILDVSKVNHTVSKCKNFRDVSSDEVRLKIGETVVKKKKEDEEIESENIAGFHNFLMSVNKGNDELILESMKYESKEFRENKEKYQICSSCKDFEKIRIELCKIARHLPLLKLSYYHKNEGGEWKLTMSDARRERCEMLMCDINEFKKSNCHKFYHSFVYNEIIKAIEDPDNIFKSCLQLNQKLASFKFRDKEILYNPDDVKTPEEIYKIVTAGISSKETKMIKASTDFDILKSKTMNLTWNEMYYIFVYMNMRRNKKSNDFHKSKFSQDYEETLSNYSSNTKVSDNSILSNVSDKVYLAVKKYLGSSFNIDIEREKRIKEKLKYKSTRDNFMKEKQFINELSNISEEIKAMVSKKPKKKRRKRKQDIISDYRMIGSFDVDKSYITSRFRRLIKGKMVYNKRFDMIEDQRFLPKTIEVQPTLYSRSYLSYRNIIENKHLKEEFDKTCALINHKIISEFQIKSYFDYDVKSETISNKVLFDGKEIKENAIVRKIYSLLEYIKNELKSRDEILECYEEY